MIIFQESYNGYIATLKENAKADCTIYFYLENDSTREFVIRNAVFGNKKIYSPIKYGEINGLHLYHIIKYLTEHNVKSLNISGTIDSKNQEEYDIFVHKVLNYIINSPFLKEKITLIRTSGQPGFEEAGAKAGEKLNIPTLVYAPKNWMFKSNGIICDENLFKQRFYER